jgi:hypothetical protein
MLALFILVFLGMGGGVVTPSMAQSAFAGFLSLFSAWYVYVIAEWLVNS